MAITKILYLKDCGKGYPGKHLKQSIDYITVPTKCGNGTLVSAVNCQSCYAYEQMIKTKEHFYKTDKRQGYHIIISFAEGEVTPEMAFKIVGEFVEEYLGSKGFEAVYAIHDNTAHVHGHIIFNSVNYLTGKKYRYEKGDWAKYMQPVTNRLCEKYGLSTITIEEDTALEHDSYVEWKDRKDGRFVWSDMIRRDLDACIIQADDFDDFVELLTGKGYEVKQNKYLAVKPPGMKRYRRCHYFGDDYTEERIKERILSENMESYRNPSADAKIIRVTVPYHIKRAKLSGLQRKYFARLYRAGRLKQRPYSQAWKYREEIRKMHKLHEEYMFLADYEIHSVEKLQKVCGTLEEKKKSVERERKAFFRERAGFKSLFAIRDRLTTLSYAETAYQDGDHFFEDEHKEYEELIRKLQDKGYTVDEVDKIKEKLKDRAQTISENYKTAGREYRLARRLLKQQSEEERSIRDVNKEEIKRQSRN